MVLIASSVIVVSMLVAGWLVLWYAWWTSFLQLDAANPYFCFFFSLSYLKGSLVVVLLLMDVHVSNFCQRYTCLRSQALQVLLLLQLECMFVAWILTMFF